MGHYLFCEKISNLEFIIDSHSFPDAAIEAEGIACTIGDHWNNGEWELIYYGELTEEEAEASGLEEY